MTKPVRWHWTAWRSRSWLKAIPPCMFFVFFCLFALSVSFFFFVAFVSNSGQVHRPSQASWSRASRAPPAFSSQRWASWKAPAKGSDRWVTGGGKCSCCLMFVCIIIVKLLKKGGVVGCSEMVLKGLVEIKFYWDCFFGRQIHELLQCMTWGVFPWKTFLDEVVWVVTKHSNQSRSNRCVALSQTSVHPQRATPVGCLECPGIRSLCNQYDILMICDEAPGQWKGGPLTGT